MTDQAQERRARQYAVCTLRGGPRHLTVWIREQDRREIDLIEIDNWLRGVCVA